MTRLIAAMTRRLGFGTVFAAGLLAACGTRIPPAPVIVPIEIEVPKGDIDNSQDGGPWSSGTR